MDFQEHAEKRLKELSDEELKLKEEIKEIQTDRNAILKMLNAIKGKSKKRRRNESKPSFKSIGPNQR